MGPAAAAGILGLGLVAGVSAAVDPRLLMVPVGLVVGAWVVVRAPGVGLGAYLFLPFYKAALSGIVPIDLTVLLAAVNALQLGPLVLAGERPVRGSSRGTTAWLAFGILVVAGITWAADPALGASRAATWWLLVVAPLIAAYRVASRPAFVDQLLATGLAIGLAVVAIAIPGIFGSARLAAAGENTLQTGAITLLTALLAGAWVAPAVPLVVRGLAAAVIAVAIVESVASGSRGPLLAFGAVVAVAVVGRITSASGLRRSDLAVGLGLVALGLVVVAVADRLPGASLARLGQLDEAVGGRTTLWAAGLDLFSQRPVLGQGTGGFAAYAAAQPRLLEFTYPHNDLVQVAAELGIVGLAVIVTVLGFAFLRPLPGERRWAVIRLVGLFMLLVGMVSGDLYGDRLLWGLVVLQLAAGSDRGHGATAPGPSNEPAFAEHEERDREEDPGRRSDDDVQGEARPGRRGRRHGRIDDRQRLRRRLPGLTEQGCLGHFERRQASPRRGQRRSRRGGVG
jgi:O-antigen ligase